jgi:hypothetical protein
MSKARADRLKKLNAYCSDLESHIRVELAESVEKKKTDTFQMKLPDITLQTERNDWNERLNKFGLYFEAYNCSAELITDYAKPAPENRALYDLIVAHNNRMLAERRAAEKQQIIDQQASAAVKAVWGHIFSHKPEVIEAVIKRLKSTPSSD